MDRPPREDAVFLVRYQKQNGGVSRRYFLRRGAAIRYALKCQRQAPGLVRMFAANTSPWHEDRWY